MLSHTLVGHGPVRVIAAHSWLADHSTFDPMMEYVDRDQFTVALPDFRGYGASRGMTGDFSIDEMASDLLAVADDLGWSSFGLCGHSMGGQAAQLLAAQHPGRVSSMLLLCSVPPRGFPLDDGTGAFFCFLSRESRCAGADHRRCNGRPPGRYFRRGGCSAIR